MFGKLKKELKNAAANAVKNAMQKEPAAEPIQTNEYGKYFDFDLSMTYYHQAELQNLGIINENFETLTDGKEYKYKKFYHSPVLLQFEPSNEFDENAIKVIIRGQFVGYVPGTHNIAVGKLMKTNHLKFCTALIRGGDYAYIQNGNRYVTPNEITCNVRVYYE